MLKPVSKRQDPKAPKNIPIEVLEKAFSEHGSFNAVARELDIDRRGVTRRLRKHWKNIGLKNADSDIPNYAPGTGRNLTKVSKTLDKNGKPKAYHVREEIEPDETDFAHPLDRLKRVSTYRGADGSIKGQWEITVSDDEKTREAFDQIVEAFKEEIPRQKTAPMAINMGETLLHNNYVLSDAHIGSLAWAPESGADWDLKIAEEMLVKAMSAMIGQSPPAYSCTVSLLGDWMHYDKFEAVTTLSGNILDGDGRQPKMNKVAIRVARQVVNMALSRHPQVTLLVAEGNHDIIAANWLREMFIVLYENEPRVQVVDDPRPYYGWLQGDIFHGWHHGHLKGAPKIDSAEKLVAIFADEYREYWGQAKKVYINTGHFHSFKQFHVRGATVIQHPTLTVRDSHAMRHGWQNERAAIGSTYHGKYGLTGTVNVSPEMLADI